MDHIHSSLKITLSQISDKGPKPENQDTLGARLPEGSQLATKGIAIAIADGVSSSKSAKQASQSAITGFLTDYYATPDTWRTQQSATQVIQSLNRYLWGQSQNSVLGEGFLTTFSTLILKGDKAFIFHIGDTRVYRFRDNSLDLLTRDHTQKIDKDTVYLSRALGADSVLEIDIHSEELQKGDIFILTSDGIHDAIPVHKFDGLVRQASSPEEITETAIKLAEEFNTQDNISIQAVRVDELGTPSQQDAVTVLSRLPFPPLLNEGNILDGLKVERVLQESERSQVYLVKDEQGRSLVMKTPSDNYDDDPAYIERFVMESWIGARIQSAQVARVIPPPQERRFLYYLTEYIPGQTLGEAVKERAPLPIPDTIELLEHIIKGVRAFHRKDTLHQDLKPDNIIVGANGPVIIDFGSCWVAGVQEVGSAVARDTILGTLSYSAPEYRYGGKISQRSEQFSLAVIVYEALTSKKPYGEAYEKAMDLRAFQRLTYTPARKYNPMIPLWLDKALEKALDMQPSARYSSLSEWLTDVKRPNPMWLNPQETPLFEKHPTRVWQIIAALGWAIALTLVVQKFT